MPGFSWLPYFRYLLILSLVWYKVYKEASIIITAHHSRLIKLIKVGCVFPMVINSILPRAEFGPNGHRKDAPLFSCRKMTSIEYFWVRFHLLVLTRSENASLLRIIISPCGPNPRYSLKEISILFYKGFVRVFKWWQRCWWLYNGDNFKMLVVEPLCWWHL